MEENNVEGATSLQITMMPDNKRRTGETITHLFGDLSHLPGEVKLQLPDIHHITGQIEKVSMCRHYILDAV